MAELSRVHYVLVRFPKLSETFVLSEMLGLEALGCEVSVDTLEDPLDEPRDGRLAALRATVRRVPDRPPARALLGVHLRLGARRPAAWLTGAWRALRERDWPGFLSANLIQTGDRTFCIIGEWSDMDAIAAARPSMLATAGVKQK